MSEQAVPQPEPTEEDVNTTPPNPQMADGKGGWKMPEPVFRKTSGYLPQGFEKRYSQEESRSSADDSESTADMTAPDLSADIEPQPEISEVPNMTVSAASAAVAAAPRKRSGAKLVLLVFGLILALGLLVVAAAVFYLFYILPTPDATF